MLLQERAYSRTLLVVFIGTLLLLSSASVSAQTKKPKKPEKQTELARLREEFINATKDYKASLTKLIALYERDVTRIEQDLAKSQTLLAEGLISRNQVAQNEITLAAAKDKVAQASRSLANADTQISATLLEAQAEAQIARTPMRRGTTMRTASYIRFTGAGSWLLSEAWKVQRFFSDSFGKQLPIAVFGQGAIHDRWRLDHRNSMDVSLHPDTPEGQALINFMRANGIPFLAFRGAIPGTATGPHIHIGRPSHRY